MKKLMLVGLLVVSAISFARNGNHGHGSQGPKGVKADIEYKFEVVRPLSIVHYDNMVDFGVVSPGGRPTVLKDSEKAKIVLKGDKYKDIEVMFDSVGDLRREGYVIEPSIRDMRNSEIKTRGKFKLDDKSSSKNSGNKDGYAYKTLKIGGTLITTDKVASGPMSKKVTFNFIQN